MQLNDAVLGDLQITDLGHAMKNMMNGIQAKLNAKKADDGKSSTGTSLVAGAKML